MNGDLSYSFDAEDTRLGDPPCQRIGARHEHLSDREGLGEPSPLGVGEADGARHGHVQSRQGFGHRPHLPAQSVDDLRAIATAHVETVVDLEEPADVALLDEAGVVLGVHDPDARAGHHEMIDVPLGLRDLTVVEQYGAVTQALLEAGRELALADRPLLPRGDRLGIVGQELDNSGQASELGVDPRISRFVASLELFEGRPARYSGLQLRNRWGRLNIDRRRLDLGRRGALAGVTWFAGHGPRLAVPPRVRASHEFDTADGADVGATKRQTLGRHRETVVIVGTVSMALTLGQWCHGIASWQTGDHIRNPLRDR